MLWGRGRTRRLLDSTTIQEDDGQSQPSERSPRELRRKLSTFQARITFSGSMYLQRLTPKRGINLYGVTGGVQESFPIRQNVANRPMMKSRSLLRVQILILAGSWKHAFFSSGMECGLTWKPSRLLVVVDCYSADSVRHLLVQDYTLKNKAFGCLKTDSMGDTQSCLRNTSSQSSLDMAKGGRARLQQGHAYDPNWEGRNKREGDLIELGEVDNDDLLNSEESPTGSLSEAVPVTPGDLKGKKPKVDNFDWSVPRRIPKGVADENFPKPRLLSHTARRERLEELKRLNQQLKSSPRNPPPPAKFQPVRKTVTYSEPSEPSECSRGPSLLELEVQALASLGFVKLQPDIGVEAGPSERKALSEVEELDPRRGDPSVRKTSEPPKTELETEDLLELEKVAPENMKAEKMPGKSPQEAGTPSDLLDLQKVALASLRTALHPDTVDQAVPSLSQSQETANSNLLELQTKALPRGKCPRHPQPIQPNPSPLQEKAMKYLLHTPATPSTSKPPLPVPLCLLHPPSTQSTSKPPLLTPSPELHGKSNVIEVQKMGQPYRRCKLHPDGAPFKPLVLPSSEPTPKYNLPHPPRKCVLHPSTALSRPSLPEEFPRAARSVQKSASASEKPPPPLLSDLLELQKAALTNMRVTSTSSPSQLGVTPPAAPSTAPLPVGPERGDLLELEKVALANMKETPIFPISQSVPAAATPPNAPANMRAASTSSPSQSGVGPPAAPPPTARPSFAPERGDLLELEKVALANMRETPVFQPSRLVAPAAAPPANAKSPASDPAPSTARRSFAPERGDLLELEKVALANMRETPVFQPSRSVAAAAAPPANAKSPASDPAPSTARRSFAPERGDLLELEKVALANMRETPVFQPSRSVAAAAAPPPNATSPVSDLTELQKAALANMRKAITSSPSQSGGVPPAVPSTAPQSFAPERGDLLELEKVALANMKGTPVFLSSTSVAAVAAPPNAPSPASDLMELQKVALASMKASAKRSQEAQITRAPESGAKSSVESDLLELQRAALANMLAASKQDGQEELKVRTSTTAKDEVQSSVVTPTSSCSSFHLEPASGPLETMLVELTSKERALQAANRKVAEKEQLLHEYEGELSKALKMLESMNVRCTDAKEETARALSEAKHIYDELSQAWSAVEDLETRSKNGAEFSPANLNQGCSKETRRDADKDNKLADEERKRWIEDFLDELQRIESARSEVHRDFEQQIQRNEKIIVELQHLRSSPCVEHMLGGHEGEWQSMHGLTHDRETPSNSGQEGCDHVFVKQVTVCETGTNPEIQNLDRTSEQLVLELREIESIRQENQKLCQEQMYRNDQVLAQLQEMQSCYQEEKQQQALVASEQQKQWDREEAQLNAHISELHEALDELNEVLDGKTKEANELHEQTLRLQKSVLEQEQQLIKVLEYQKTDRSPTSKSATADFNGDTSELEAYVCPSCYSAPDKSDFIGDTLDLVSYVCSPCSLADYICANCSNAPTGSDVSLAKNFCPSIKAETADFECDTREFEISIHTMDFQGDTRELELESAIRTMDFEGDTSELENVVHKVSREDKSVQVRRDDRERKRLAQERENWEVERKELIKRLDEFEVSLLAKEEKIGNLIEKLEKDESNRQEEKYQLVKRAEECETRLLAKEEEVIELSTQLDMAKSTLQGFTYVDSSTVVSTSSDISTVPTFSKKGSKSGSHAIQRHGRSDARELLDLRCEVFSLHECLEIKGEALKTMENELTRSYAVINELRTKLARAQESERSLVGQQNSHRSIPDDSQLTSVQSLGEKLRGKVAKKPRLLKEFDQVTMRPNQNQAELLEKLRDQSEKLAALGKERAIMSRKIDDLTAKCSYLEGIEKLYRESQDPLKAEAIMELEKELERNVEIIQKIQLRCSEFESRTLEAENRLNQVQSGVNSIVPRGPSAKERKEWQTEREGLLAGLKYFREQTEKKDEELYLLRYELRARKQKQIRTPRTPPPACKSSLIFECPDTHNGPVVEMVVHDANSGENSSLQLARLHTLTAANRELEPRDSHHSRDHEGLHAPTAAILEFERRDNNHNHHNYDHEDDETSTSQTLQIRELTKHITDQWKLQCVMEDRLDTMMDYISERVKEFELQSRNVSPSANFAQFHDEARLMKSQLEQQLQVLRGTLSTSFHKLDEAKRQLQVAAAVSASAKEVQCLITDSDTTERSPDDAAADNKGKSVQLSTEKVALEDSAQTLQEKTSRLLHRLTSTRLQWNMNMLAASMAAG